MFRSRLKPPLLQVALRNMNFPRSVFRSRVFWSHSWKIYEVIFAVRKLSIAEKHGA